jgi:Tfp pilus assembly protein PilN
MTALIEAIDAPAPQEARCWAGMPGWGIAADLTPPEVLTARRAKAVRRLVLVALTGVLVLCAGVSVLGFRHTASAAGALHSEQARSASLRAQQQRYADVIRVQGTLGSVRGQLATLLAGDVDFGALAAAVDGARPAAVRLSQVTAVLTPTTGVGVPATPSGLGSLDNSGRQHLGSLTITGTASSISGIARYTDRLGRVRGAVAADPVSEQRTAGGVQFTIELTLTDSLLTGHYAVGRTGGS